jgi:nucleoid DNA-binding protein
MTSPLKSNLFTDKPISLSVKDYLIRRLAVKMMLSEKTIETVVNHQFQSAHEALSQNKSLEISGFGKFFFNEKKAHKMMEKFLSQKALFEKRANDETFSEAKRRSYGLKLQTALDGIRDLKPRIYDSFPNLRGVEEQPTAAQKVEEHDKGNE